MDTLHQVLQIGLDGSLRHLACSVLVRAMRIRDCCDQTKNTEEKKQAALLLAVLFL